METPKYVDYLKIGFIQTVVIGDLAWPGPIYSIMEPDSEERVWKEIKKGFSDLLNGGEKPKIIIIPELSVPHGYENDLKKLSAATGAVVIGGMDFYHNDGLVANRATVIVPSNWPSDSRSRSTSSFYFGKFFYSNEEIKMFGVNRLLRHPEILVIDAGEYGKIGVAICSDFFDVDRFTMYKGRIHHLIIISHNKDVDSYYFLAEAISRLVYCNVAICNTGEYGDSIGFSPYKDNFKRILYRHKGSNLFSTQVVTFPLKHLNDEQKDGVENEIFKSRPPGYRKIEF
jgi:hypothetical protein